MRCFESASAYKAVVELCFLKEFQKMGNEYNLNLNICPDG